MDAPPPQATTAADPRSTSVEASKVSSLIFSRTFFNHCCVRAAKHLIDGPPAGKNVDEPSALATTVVGQKSTNHERVINLI
jgi:hypothetical protein